MKDPIIILKTGSTCGDIARDHGDFEDWIVDGLGVSADDVVVADARGPAPLPDVEGVAGVVVTGSHANVTDDEPWMGRACEWLREAARHGVPTLGIYSGHERAGRTPVGVAWTSKS